MLMMLNADDLKHLRMVLSDPCLFAALGGLRLRNYQRNVAYAITKSVLSARGNSFVVMFPRQSGKNELQAQVEAYLLLRLFHCGGELVKISPTWKPQSQNAMRRLQRVLTRHPLLQHQWQKDSGYRFGVGKASISFLSGAPEANIVGATASTLLQVDEAQDVSIEKYDKEIAPMAASTNATRVFWGTAWTEDTLLARELRLAQQLESQDGVQRAFVLDADDVAREVPAYGRFVQRQIEQLGRDHPMVRTQFYSEILENGGKLFHPGRLALMRGEHATQTRPQTGMTYIFCLDVAGEDQGLAQDGQMSNPRRDYNALTIFSILSKQTAWGIPQNHYQVVSRHAWQGIVQSELFEQLLALAKLWNPRQFVVDATGVGAGIASFLQRALAERVIPFQFSAVSKSRLGWDFLGVIDSGRFKDHQDETAEQTQFYAQAKMCKSSISIGPERLLRWQVPAGTRDELGREVHDDWLISAALCALFEKQACQINQQTMIIPAGDPLQDIDRQRHQRPDRRF
jgi:hypothetical protein